MQAGYRVYSYEISAPRSQYAEEKLGCHMISDLDSIPERADCFFSAHVIEHLVNPIILWESALKVLKPNGIIILFMPNGDYSLEQQRGDVYHKIWGQVHPLVLSEESLTIMAQRFGFVGRGYSSPYDLSKINRSITGQLRGDELLFIARRSS